MQLYKIYKKGNYIYFEYEDVASKIIKKRYSAIYLTYEKEDLVFIVNHKTKGGVLIVEVNSGLNELGIPYTETQLETFLNENTSYLGGSLEDVSNKINGQPIATQNGIFNSGTQRVVSANRIETIVSNIGTLSDIPLTAGQRIKLLNHTNDTAVLFYLQIHNKATSLATGDIPQSIFRVPANSTINEGAGFFGESGTLYGANTRIGYSSTFGTYTAINSIGKSTNIILVA